MVGRTIRCPKCGGDVLVTAAAPSATAPAGKGKVIGKTPAALAADRRKAAAVPAVSVSPAIVTAAVVGAIVLAVFLTLYLGPWSVSKKWEAMSAQANTEVTDVVMFAMQAHQSQTTLAIGSPMSRPPAIEGPAMFIPPMMAFSMPRQVQFGGRTSQGGYIGKYDTTNGEITVDIEVGGYRVGGLVDMRKPTGSLHVTGREKDGTVTAEADGEPLTILVPKFKGKYDE